MEPRYASAWYSDKVDGLIAVVVLYKELSILPGKLLVAVVLEA